MVDRTDNIILFSFRTCYIASCSNNIGHDTGKLRELVIPKISLAPHEARDVRNNILLWSTLRLQFGE